MTFSVRMNDSEKQQIVGTIWAKGESEAKCIASEIYSRRESGDTIDVRQIEERELPFRVE